MLRLEYLKYRLQQSPAGRSVLDLFDVHGEEVQMLFKTYREIMITWHRHHGPKFIAEGLKNASDQDLRFIPEVESTKLGTLIRKMAAVFLDHASPELSHSIEQNLPAILTWTSEYKGLNEVFEHLNHEEQVD